MTDEELDCMPWTRDLMTTRAELDAWVASRQEAGRAIDIATCELGRWAALDLDPYGVCAPGEVYEQIGTNRFVRSPESRGWVHEGDLPTESAWAMYDRIDDEYDLFLAAAEKHPGWRVVDGQFPRPSDDEAPNSKEVVEWYRDSFPNEFRATKIKIRAARARKRLQRRASQESEDT